MRSSLFVQVLDDVWLWFKFAPVGIKIAAVFLGVLALAMVIFAIMLFIVEPALGVIALILVGTFVAGNALLSYDEQSDYARKEAKEDREHRKEHPRPMYDKMCYRCAADRNGRTPMRYLGGR